MSTQKYLGKIEHVNFGLGGYQGVMFGLSISFKFDGSSGISTFIGGWSPSHITCDKHTKWTEDDRDRDLIKLARFVDKTLYEAKKEDVTKLVGVPVEIELEGNTLKSWRVLTEVL